MSDVGVTYGVTNVADPNSSVAKFQTNVEDSKHDNNGLTQFYAAHK